MLQQIGKSFAKAKQIGKSFAKAKQMIFCFSGTFLKKKRMRGRRHLFASDFFKQNLV